MRLYGSLLVLLALVAGAVVFLAFSRTDTTRVALCALRADIDNRISSSEQFLKEHPQGIPGIPASLIRQTLKNSKRTRAALDVLSC